MAKNDKNTTPPPAAPLPDFGSEFAAISGMSEVVRIADNTRVVIGSGNEFLSVPGLQSLEAINIGGQDVPLVEKREYPTDTTHTRFETKEHRLFVLTAGPDGTPVLLRSKLSNYGIWQKGARILITGKFGSEAPAEPAEAE